MRVKQSLKPSKENVVCIAVMEIIPVHKHNLLVHHVAVQIKAVKKLIEISYKK